VSRALVIVAVIVAAGAIALLVLTRAPAPATTTTPSRDAAIAHADASHTDATAAAIAIDAAASAERVQVIAGLSNSGAGAEAWNAQALALLDSLAQRGVAITDAACFVAGCGATFTFPSEAEYRRRIDELQRSDAYRAWTGGKRLTSPELAADGRVTIAVALYRPD
jgi:hypothetical protein